MRAFVIPNIILNDNIQRKTFCSDAEHVEVEFLQNFLLKLLLATGRAIAKRFKKEGGVIEFAADNIGFVIPDKERLCSPTPLPRDGNGRLIS